MGQSPGQNRSSVVVRIETVLDQIRTNKMFPSEQNPPTLPLVGGEK